MAKTDIWDLLQYNSPLSFHRTGLSWSAEKYTGWSIRKESLKKFRLWEFEIMQRAPDGLAWWSLACAVPSFHSPMPCRGRSLSLSRPTTHWGQSLLVGGHSQWGHSQASLRPLSGQATEQEGGEPEPLCAKCFAPTLLPSPNVVAHVGHVSDHHQKPQPSGQSFESNLVRSEHFQSTLTRIHLEITKSPGQDFLNRFKPIERNQVWRG